ncbi:MAG: Holliday junction resolvase RuvX [Myxococcota bacterium]
MRVLGVDPGSRRIGLAISDEGGGRIALPLATVVRGPDDREAAAKVRQALGEVVITNAVVGLPLRLDGSEGQAARRVRRFAEALEHALKVPVSFLDERLTTVMAERSLRESGARDRRAVVDQAAAVIILQNYLDRREAAWRDD